VSRPTRGFVVALAVIAVVAVAIRLFWVLVVYDHFEPGVDAIWYHWQGWTIAEGRWFIDPAPWYFPKPGGGILRMSVPSAGHPPLYGLYLGLVSWLGFWSVTAHRVASCLLGSGAVVMIGLAGRKLRTERVGLIAAGIAAVYANLWINDGLLLAESLAALLVAWILYAAYSYWHAPTWGRAAVLGLAFGLTALCRAEALLLAPLLALPLLLGMRRLPMATRVKMLAVVAGCIIVVVGPWIGYNLSRFEEPVTMTSSDGRVLAAASCDATYYGATAGWFSDTECPALTPRNVPDGDPSVLDARQRAAAVRYIRNHLGRLPVVMAMRVGRLWEVYEPAQTRELGTIYPEKRTPGASRIAQYSYWVLAPLAIAGVILTWRRKVPISPLVAPAIVVTLAAAMYFGVVRYRLTAEPAIVLGAAVAIEAIWVALRARRATGSRPKAPTTVDA
jgi:Dolichyl-phosphate-mannose-protein mannosyltransferase